MSETQTAHRERLAGPDGIGRMVESLAAQIVAPHGAPPDLTLVGIKTRGLPLAQRIARVIKRLEDVDVPVEGIDVSHWDDRGAIVETNARAISSDLRFDVNSRRIVLVDDVLFTGRSVRAAVDALLARGNPEAILLAVLIDRQGHHELPVCANYVGRPVSTKANDWVWVYLSETDEGAETVVMGPKPRYFVPHRRRRPGQQPMPGFRVDALTNRQREILALIAQGLTNKEIATELGIKPSAVDTHVELILQTLDVPNRAAAARIWAEEMREMDRPR